MEPPPTLIIVWILLVVQVVEPKIAMHRALLVDDIVNIILENVESSGTDMINLACTCSSLSSLALDILWRAQPHLGPLIMCLPQDKWEIGNGNFIHLYRKLLPVECDRVRLNASRIRKLVINPEKDSKHLPKAHHCTLLVLFALFPPASLFPNLAYLNFSAVPDLRALPAELQLPVLSKFLSPRLAFLSFSLPPGVSLHKLEQFCDGLPEKAHGLRELVISGPNRSSRRRQIRLPLVKMQKLIALVVFRNMSLMPRSIADIKHLRFLHTLALRLLDGGSDAVPDARLDGTLLELNRLEFLLLDADSMQHCTSFLLRVSASRLSSLSIMYKKHALFAEVNDFCLSLYTACPIPASLEKLSVDGHLNQPLNPLPSHVFRPLLKFRGLTSVKFLAVGKYCLDDDFVEDMAVAWPDIQELKFASKQTDMISVTFSAVLTLATQCRSLRTLHITFDTTQSPMPPMQKGCEGVPDTIRLWPKQTALRILHVGNSKVHRAVSVPFVLAVVFPNLLHICSYQIPGVSDDARWEQVARTFQQLMGLHEKDPDMAAELPQFVLHMLADLMPPELR